MWKSRLTSTLLCCVALFPAAHGGQIASAAEKLLGQSPAEAYEKAITRKDYRLITVPFCGGTTPGFNFMAYRGPKPEENDLGIDCRTLLGEAELDALLKLEAWATEYNALMYGRLINAK